MGFKVRYVRNITDVGELTDDVENGEDKIMQKARLEQMEPMEIAGNYRRSFPRDMDSLNILPADISPRTSAHIPEPLELARLLIEKGYAYESTGSVF